MATEPRSPEIVARIVPDPTDDRDHTYEVDDLAGPLPRSIEPDVYRTIVGTTWHQRGEECTGFALAAIANFLLRRHAGDPTLPSVSRRMLYESAQLHDDRAFVEGSTLRGALKGWNRTGVARDDLWPYDPDDEHGDVHGSLTLARLLDARHRPLVGYRRIPSGDVDRMRHALASARPLFAAAQIHVGWYRLFMPESGTRIQRRPDDADKGGHAFVIVGYDAEGFWLHNSWGPEWGEEGYGHLSYDDWIASGMDTWVVDLAPEMLGELGGTPIEPSPSADEQAGYRDLWPHLVVLTDDGGLAQTGLHEMDEGSVRTLGFLFGERTRDWPRRRLAIVFDDARLPISETIERYRLIRDRYMRAGVYPIFVMWETSWEADLVDELDRWSRHLAPRFGASDPPYRLGDPLLVAAAKASVVKPIWHQMLERAGRAAQAGGGAAVLADTIAKKLLTEREQGRDFEVHLVTHGVGDLLQSQFVTRLSSPAHTATVAASATPLGVAWRTYDIALDRGMLGQLYLYSGARADSVEVGPVDGALLDVLGELLAPGQDGRPVALVGRMLDQTRATSDRVSWRVLNGDGDVDTRIHEVAIAIIDG